ncbi:F-box domain-containing protein [Zopfochytrium polystomum]|nr:F-box domain-containing protein [Zopfochytrium polystomum]
MVLRHRQVWVRRQKRFGGHDDRIADILPAFPIDPTSLSQSKMRAAATIVSEATQHQPTNTRGQSEERDAHSVTQGAVGSALPNSTSSSALPLDHERRVPLDSPPLTPLEDASGDDIFDLSPVNGGVAPSGRLDFISILPPEVICHIMLLVSPLDLSLCGCVSRSWRVFARSNIVWREMCRRRWSDKQFHPLELNPLVDW